MGTDNLLFHKTQALYISILTGLAWQTW